jgi:hypothetical protein
VVVDIFAVRRMCVCVNSTALCDVVTCVDDRNFCGAKLAI